LLAVGLGLVVSIGPAQEPKGRQDDVPKRGKGETATGANSLVDRLMAFDKNKDGKVTKDELTDERLMRLFNRADADKNGEVTREELNALAAQVGSEAGSGGGGGDFKGGKGRKGKDGGDFGPPDGEKGPGFGKKGFPPRPGQVLPPFLQERLMLTDEQKKQIDELQKDVDARLAKILTEEQQKILRERSKGFGGFGGKDRPPPGPGGGPPGSDGPRPGFDGPPPLPPGDAGPPKGKKQKGEPGE